MECYALWRVRFPGLLGRRRLRLLIAEKCKGLSEAEQDAIFEAVLAEGRLTSDREVREMHAASVSQSEAAPPPSDASDVSGATSPPN